MCLMILGLTFNCCNTTAEAEKVAEVAEIQYNQRIMEKKKQKEISQVGYETILLCKTTDWWP